MNDVVDQINKQIDTINSNPQGSPEWSEALDRISKPIKDLEARLESMSASEVKEVRLSVSVDREGKAGTSIEIPAGQRIIYYSDFSELFRKPEESLKKTKELMMTRRKNTDKSSLFNILKDAIIRSKDKFVDDGNFEHVLKKLEELKKSYPKDNASLSQKIQWFKELAKTLYSLKIIKPAIKSIKDETPRIWSQLTFKQKLQVVLLGPAAGVGFYIGNIGVALLGTAFGIPATIVVLILLFVTNQLIGLLDFLIELLGSLIKNKKSIQEMVKQINEQINNVNPYPQESPERSEALDKISKDIEGLEVRLKSMPDLPNEIKEVRLSVSVDKKGKAGTTIEIPEGKRIIYYSDFSELFIKSEENQRTNENKKNTDKSSLFNILKDAIIRSKDKFADDDNLEDVLRDLKEHRETVPKDNANLSEKGQWLKELAKTLYSLGIIEPAIKSLKDEFPKIWDQLTFKQKLQVALLAPVVGVGNIGYIPILFFTGMPVGISAIPVILILLVLLLFVTNKLSEFLDFLIEFLGERT